MRSQYKEKFDRLRDVIDHKIDIKTAIILLDDLFADIEKETNKSEQDAIISELTSLAAVLNETKRPSRRMIQKVNVRVEQFIDATVIKIEDKVDPETMLECLTGVVSKPTDGLLAMSYMPIGFIKLQYKQAKDIIIDIENWYLSERMFDLYLDEFSQLLVKN